MDYLRVSIEGTLALSVAAVTLYLHQRTVCLYSWLKTTAMMAIAAFYACFVCTAPAVVGIFSYEMLRSSDSAFIDQIAMPVAAMSPLIMLMNLYRESPQGWHEVSSLPFYIFHFVIAAACVFLMSRRSRKLQSEYVTVPAREVRS